MEKKSSAFLPALVLLAFFAGGGDAEAQAAGNQLSNPPPLVTLTKKADDPAQLEWHIVLPVNMIAGHHFEIRSALKGDKPTDLDNSQKFDPDYIAATLVKAGEIQEKPGNPVNITYRLNPAQKTNPYDPHLQVSSGFSRVGHFEGSANSTIKISAYATSGPVKFLGTTITDVKPLQETAFTGPRLLLATVATSDAKHSYSYEIFLQAMAD